MRRCAVLDKESREHRQIYPQPGWVEHDAEEIWRNTCDAVRRLPMAEMKNFKPGLSA